MKKNVIYNLIGISAILAVLNLCGVININWWWVLAPALLPLLAVLIIVLVVSVILRRK